MELNEALLKLSTGEWEMWAFDEESEPLGFVYIYWWDDCANVVLLGDPRFASVYRARIDDEIHPFSPDVINWYFGGRPEVAIQKLLRLPEPSDALAPTWGNRFHGPARVPLTWLQAPKQCVRPSIRAPNP